MAQVIDYNAIAASVYQTVLGLNSIATSLVGLDCMWCRLLPYDNGEDVIVQEYTLHQYECPKALKAITSNTDYQIGNYMVDLWGVHSEVPLEISIDINTWKSIYGEGTMPQKGDFVLFTLLHKAFEVKSSSVVYTVGEQPTSYKCQLGTWQHNANRKESEEFTQSINEITDSQDRLFGEAISREVADAVVETETSFNNTTYEDPLKTFDPNMVITERLIGENGNTISDAYYDFLHTKQNVEYQVAAEYDRECKENHWIFTCWFKTSENDFVKTGSVKLGKDPYIKDKDYWWFDIESEIPIEVGDQVTIYRGGIIKLNGIIENKECETSFVIRIPTSDCLKASKKVSVWWKQGTWKIQNHVQYNIITGYNNDSNTFGINIDQNNLYVKLGQVEKKFIIADGHSNDYKKWHYLAIDFGPSSTRVILAKLQDAYNSVDKKVSKSIVIDKTQKFRIENFMFDSLAIENTEQNIQMCNIRLYENEYPVGDTYEMDMYSNVTRNASKLIVVDGPIPVNTMSFISPVK